MPQQTIIIDACNAMHRIPELRQALAEGLDTARVRLLRLCRQWLAGRRDVANVYVVFDSRANTHAAAEQDSPRLRVVYSSAEEEADGRIVALLRGHKAPATCVVVSADNYVMNSARAHAARILSPSEFFSLTTAPGRARRSRLAGGNGGPPGLPGPARKAIKDELKEAWGLGDQ